MKKIKKFICTVLYGILLYVRYFTVCTVFYCMYGILLYVRYCDFLRSIVSMISDFFFSSFNT